jgi:hypothetical protein
MHREHSSNPNASINRYTFGTLTLSFKGLGVPFLSDKTQATIAAMDLEQATQANRAAWKAIRDTTKVCNRHNNFSAPGNASIYDRAYQHNQVAEQVKRLTWQRMRELRG